MADVQQEKHSENHESCLYRVTAQGVDVPHFVVADSISEAVEKFEECGEGDIQSVTKVAEACCLIV